MRQEQDKITCQRKAAKKPYHSKKWRKGYCVGFSQGVQAALACLDDFVNDMRWTLTNQLEPDAEALLKPLTDKQDKAKTGPNAEPNIASSAVKASKHIYFTGESGFDLDGAMMDGGIFAPDYDATVFNPQGKLKLFVRDGLCFHDESGKYGPKACPLNHEQVTTFDCAYTRLLAKFRQKQRLADEDFAVGIMVDENKLYETAGDDSYNQQFAADLADIYVASSGVSDNAVLRDEVYRSLLEQLRLREAVYDD